MYPEYEKVKSFFSTPLDLLKTQRRFEDIFNHTFTYNKNNIAVEYYNDRGHIAKAKYKKLRKLVYRYADIISNLFATEERNKPVVLKASNSYQWIVVFWAILMSGFKPLLIDARTSKEGTQNLINQSHAVGIISDDVYSYNVNKICIDDFECEDPTGEFSPNWENEVIFCSSGTTGDVKLMIYNGENIVHQIAASLDMPETTKDIMYPKCFGKVKILAMIPFHHIFGFVAVNLWYTWYGKTLVFPSSLAPSELQEICRSRKVSHIYSVPLFWESLVTQFERKKALESKEKQELIDKFISYNLGKISKEEAGFAAKPIVRKAIQKNILGSAVRYCISGGGYLNEKSINTINGIGYPLYNGFGMTELGVTSVELSYEIYDRLKGTIGKPLHGVYYKIKSNGEDPNLGELFVKSKITHIREIIGGEPKDVTLDNEGYFATGDIAYKDVDGRYFIKGRIKDIIINADGENVFPDEIEIFYKKLPHVLNLCVLGIASGEHKEDIDLVLELDNSIKEEELKELKEMIDKVGQHLPKGSTIAHVYLARHKLPMANNMKVKRFVIKKAIESGSDDYILFGEKVANKKKVNFDEETVQKYVEPIRDLFSEVLVLPKFKIEDDAHWINDLGGDSMNYVELVQKLQTKFDVVIPEDMYGQMTNINDFVEEVIKLEKEKKIIE